MCYKEPLFCDQLFPNCKRTGTHYTVTKTESRSVVTIGDTKNKKYPTVEYLGV